MHGSEDEESSESEIEDEDGELVTPALDTQILRTISLLKAKDPAVYDPKVNFFSGLCAPLSFLRGRKNKKQTTTKKPNQLLVLTCRGGTEEGTAGLGEEKGGKEGPTKTHVFEGLPAASSP
jgi:hypothetical protein